MLRAGLFFDMAQEQMSQRAAGVEVARPLTRDVEESRAPSPRRMVIRKSDVEIRSLTDWRLYAAPRGGDAQWRDYRSNKELARAWCPEGIGPTVPPETRALLSTRPEFSDFEFSEVIPEHLVRFDSLAAEPRCCNLVAVGSSRGEDFVMGVEGKTDEPYGQYVSDELVAAARRIAREIPTGSLERIGRLAGALFRGRRGGEPQIGDLRYQLLTAIAGTLAFANERQVRRAIFVTHEFRTHETSDKLLADNQRDMERFLERLTHGEQRSLDTGTLAGPFTLPGSDFISSETEFFIGKVRRELLAYDF